MSSVDALALNDRAEALYREGLPSQALNLFQQVLLEGARQDDELVRVEVARALYFAVRCNRDIGQSERAGHIETSLQKRFGNDANPLVRAWALRGDEEPSNAPPDPELDVFLHELFAGTSPQTGKEMPTSIPLEAHDMAPAPEIGPLRSSSGEVPLWLGQDEVSLARLQQIFDAAFMEARLDADGDLRVVVDETRVFLKLREELKLIRIFAAWSLKADAPPEHKLALAHRINDDFVLLRAAIPGDTTLLLDCSLPFAGGVFARQIVHLTRLFHSIAARALQTSDEDDILG